MLAAMLAGQGGGFVLGSRGLEVRSSETLTKTISGSRRFRKTPPGKAWTPAETHATKNETTYTSRILV